MKKIVNILTVMAIFCILIFPGSAFAAPLDTIDVQVDKTTVRPGEEVKVTVQFGQNLGSYTIDVSYDNNIFDYVSADGGTSSNPTGDRIKTVFYDATSPRNYMSVTFKAKSGITTSNPTEFTITATGLANSDASVTFDDITTPIVKNVTVEPQYIDYTLNLEHTGDVIKQKENAMTLSFYSSLGRYYEHARLIAEAQTPAGANVQLLATDQAGLEHDIIQSGWGDAQGFKIGGPDSIQVLQTRGIFSEIGNYTITLKLIDRDNSDAIISQKSFQFNAVEEGQAGIGQTQTQNPTTGEQSSTEQTPPVTEQEVVKEAPKKLPKTGINIYIPIIVVLIVLMGIYVYFSIKK